MTTPKGREVVLSRSVKDVTVCVFVYMLVVLPILVVSIIAWSAWLNSVKPLDDVVGPRYHRAVC